MSEQSFTEQRCQFYGTVAHGNAGAHEWLCLWHDYCHEIDDIIDIPDWSAERVIAVFERANALYTHAFYQTHRLALSPMILVATSLYNDANKWEQDPQLWKRWWAEVMRHCGNEVIFAVAQICGGYQHLKSITAPMLAMCYVYHKDKYGTPDAPKEDRTKPNPLYIEAPGSEPRFHADGSPA